MNRWIRIFAPAGALAVVLMAGGAALGNGAASAQQVASVTKPAAAQIGQPPAPTVAPQSAPDADNVQQQDGAQSQTTNDPEAKDGAETPDNEAADAAALAGKATVTADQARTTALAANPGTTVVKAELGDENGTIVYSVELSNGADVKVDANSGKITATDQPGSDNAETNDGPGTETNQ